MLVEDREPNIEQFWALWSLFAERARTAPWLEHVDNRYARGAEVIRPLFLGTAWKEEVRHWRSLEGHAHHLHTLFVFDAYIRFLYHVGEQSLPDPFIRVAKRLKTGEPLGFLVRPR